MDQRLNVITVGYAVGGPDEVDALCADAAEAGATVSRAHAPLMTWDERRA